MARPKKPKYVYVEKLNLHRKRIKDSNGKYVALYGQTPDELTERILEFSRLQEQGAGNKDNPFFNDYAQRWMDLHGAHLTFGGRADYQSCIDCNIKPHMECVLPQIVRTAQKSPLVGFLCISFVFPNHFHIRR